MAKVHVRKTFAPQKERWYPRRERLAEEIGEQRYLDEVLNPFRQMMGEEFPQSEWKRWDTILVLYAPTPGPDSLLEEWNWGADTQTKSEKQPV
jgi:hypothetical protein